MKKLRAAGCGGILLLAGGLGSPAGGAELTWGEVEIRTQATLSAGFGIRTEGRDARLICPQNVAGGATSCNGDDGNLNFDSGDFTSAPVRAQGEVEASWRNFTLYARGQAFYDIVYDQGDLAHVGGTGDYRDLAGRQTAAARHDSSHGYEVMDLWLRGSFDLGEATMVARLGQQTITWGEALFSPLSLSQINAFDQSKLRQPGAELRDAMVAMPAALLTLDLGDGLSVESFYQFAFRSSRADPAGSFFSTNDVAGRGGAGFGGGGDYDQTAPAAPGSISVPRGTDAAASDDGENWGVALRYFSPELNNTEFGVYFANVTARSPVPSFVVADTLAPGPAAVAANARNSRFVLSNPQDVQMLGFSFNTSVDLLGISLAGEAAWMHDQPVLIDLETWANAYGCSIVSMPLLNPSCAAIGLGNQLSSLNGWGSNRPGTRIDAYTREDVFTAVLRGTRQFGASDHPASLIGANTVSLTVELGAAYVDLPSKHVLAYEAPGNGLPGSGTYKDPTSSKYSPATDFSAGVTAIAAASYPDAAAGVNLTPSLRFQTGLTGATPVTGGYVEEASALTFQVDADYLLTWRLSLGYTTYFGGRQNLLNDRDFFQMSLSYSF